jgi:hypothetical protein
MSHIGSRGSRSASPTSGIQRAPPSAEGLDHRPQLGTGIGQGIGDPPAVVAPLDEAGQRPSKGCRACVPGRVMAGIQFFEAQIDDQLLPRSRYDELLTLHGFADLGHIQISPVHAVTYARR